ncbi:hypothetical protein PLESTB_001491000 [Pleodorina starrii]|uniref:Uncharacterized protein n=1 Tax=Pleodorina starrii TaxID=330485 RepID=A0A9W6BVW5_9CHLO|nr:hypothetical protein PLESTB_001491000 [Pleodorina starrii]GLC66327.1 hypothetical protein PLESTF_000411900 [Pleodorina starrii]
MLIRSLRHTSVRSAHATRQIAPSISPNSLSPKPSVSALTHATPTSPNAITAQMPGVATGAASRVDDEDAGRLPCDAATNKGSSLAVVKPVSDRRSYEFVTVGGDGDAVGTRFLLVSDPEAVFAAACLNMQAGYFDDPIDVPGFAHWLEHAVHLGSGRYPDDKDYKYYLSQHGGTSNASTGMVHTSYHFTVASPHLAGALDRLARFFIDPLLHRDSILKEAENVHAEFSRNCNSDARKLLQLRRSAAGGLLAKFSTGNAATLRDAPAAAGLDVPAALAAFWRERYLAGALCGCVVGPQELGELRRLVGESFAGVRLRQEDGGGGNDPRVCGGDGSDPRVGGDPAVGGGDPRVAGDGSDPRVVTEGASAVKSSSGSGGVSEARYGFEDMCGTGRLGRLFRVASQRELRQLEVIWYLPYGMMPDTRSKPWRWAGHVLGHEGRGSLAALLRGAGLAQELTTGQFDEVRLGRGFMFWGVTLTLSEAGLRRCDDVLRLVFAAVKAMRALGEEQRRSVWGEVAEAAEARWQYQDRTAPLDLARDAAQRLHYFGPELALSGNALMYEYDADALERFLSYITPANCNVYLSDSSFAGTTDAVEKWYGARYSEEPLNLKLYDNDDDGAAAVTPSATAAAAAAADVDTAGSPEDSYPQLLSRLRLSQPPSWALPVDVRMVSEPAAAMVSEPAAALVSEPAAAGGGAGAVKSEETAGGDAAGQQAHVGATTRGAPPPPPPPVLLEDSGSVRLWHRTDVSFGVPKTHVYAHLISRAVYDTPAGWVTARLACRLMEELLQPDVYDAQLVGTGYSLSASETGLHLSFHGFSGVVRQLAEVVGAALAGVTLQQVQARYGLVHGKLLRSLRLWRHNNPAGHAEYGTEHLLQLPHWHVEDSICVLEAAAAAEAKAVEATPPADVAVAAAKAEAMEAEAAASAEAEAVEAAPPAAVAEAPAKEAAAGVAAAEAAAGAAEAEAAAAGPRAVWQFLRGLGRSVALEVLVYGNSTEQQARDLCATLVGHLRPTGLGPDGWPATRILKLAPDTPPPAPQQQQEHEQQQPLQGGAEAEAADKAEAGRDGAAAAAPAPASGPVSVATAAAAAGPGPVPVSGPVLLRYVPANPNSSNTNSAVFLLCQVGEDDPSDVRPAVLLDLLTRVASKPAFHELRTRQRLGYVVALTQHRLGGTHGLAVRVQSPDKDPEALRERVAEWLSGFGRELRDLAPERLASFKSSLEEKYLEPPRSLAEAAGAAWRPIRYRSYDFHKGERKAAALRELGLQDLVRFYEQHACPSSPSARVLCCEIWGGSGSGSKIKTETDTQSGSAARAGGTTGTSGQTTTASGERAAAAVPAGGEEEQATGTAPGEGEAGTGAGGEEARAAAVWQLLRSEDLPELHRRLPHWCHSETMRVMRPLPLPLQGGSSGPAAAVPAAAGAEPAPGAQH